MKHGPSIRDHFDFLAGLTELSRRYGLWIVGDGVALCGSTAEDAYALWHDELRLASSLSSGKRAEEKLS